MCSNCSSAVTGGSTIVRGDGGITVAGSGTPSDPYIITVAQAAEDLRFTVRDSPTVNLLLTGSGSTADPFVLRADTSSAASLRGLGDVASTPVVTQGTVPLWIGTTAAGHFEFRTPGVRYTTSTTRGNGLYQGELARDTDTQKRYEWDGSQWLALDVAVPSFSLDPSVLQNAGSVTASTDWNTLASKSGIYRVSSGVSTTNNAPAGAYGFGTLEVLMSGNSVTQNYYTHSASRTYTRTKWNSTDWTPWVTGATTGDTANLQSSINSLTSGGLDSRYFTRDQLTGGTLDSRYPPYPWLAANYAKAPQGQVKIYTGTGVTATPTGDGTTGTYVATFGIDYSGAGFTSSPTVLISAQSGDSGYISTGVTAQPGTTSVTGILRRRNAVATGYWWIAIGS